MENTEDVNGELSRGQLQDVVSGAALIAEERRRQIEAEGWHEKHDDKHRRMEMARAAAAYVLNAWERTKMQEGATERYVLAAAVNVLWPWESEWWKPAKDPVRTLVKAGALIAAEVDRLNRSKTGTTNESNSLASPRSES